MAIRAVERISIPTLALGLDYRLQAVNIEDGALADAENFWFEGADVLTKRPGIVPVGDNLPLNGTPLHIDQFYKSSGASWLICITTTSVYYYDENKREWVDISPEGGLSGTDRDLISADIIHDTFIFTNGVDPVMQWDGLAPRVTALPSAPKGKIVRKFAERLFVLHLVIEPMSLAWSTPLDHTDFSGPGSGMVTLSQGVDWIQSAEPLGPYLVIYRERSVVLCTYVGGSQLFRFDTLAPGIGPVAPRAIVNLGNEHIFLGWDQVYSYQGGRMVEAIGDKVQERLIETLNPAEAFRSLGVIIEERNELWFATPDANADPWANKLWIFNYKYGRWLRAAYEISCFGYWQLEENLRIGDLRGRIGELSMRLGDRTFLSGSPVNLIGTKDVRIVSFDDPNVSDESEPIPAYLVTKEFHAGDFRVMKRWLGADLELLGGRCRVEYRVDGGPWFTAAELALTSTWQKYRVDFDAAGRTLQLRLSNDWSGPDGQLKVRGLDIRYMRQTRG